MSRSWANSGVCTPRYSPFGLQKLAYLWDAIAKLPKQSFKVLAKELMLEYDLDCETYPQFKMRILIAEDEPDVAQFLCQGLSEAGYAVDFALDGASALNYLDCIDYDLIVLDLMLPKVDGLSVLGKLRDRGSQTCSNLQKKVN
jgi:PleD family two-component response regulator